MKNAKNRMSRREILGLLAALGAASVARAQDPVQLNPRSYRVAFENERCRVLEYHAKPGLGVCGIGRHFHPAHLTIAMSGGKVRAVAEDGTVRTAVAPPGKLFWAPAEIHEVENISGRGMHALIIEFKDKHWKPSTG